jgi:hypothetical protein
VSQHKYLGSTCLVVTFGLLVTDMGVLLRPSCEFTPGSASIAAECDEAGPHTPRGGGRTAQFQFTPAATVSGTVTLSNGTALTR